MSGRPTSPIRSAQHYYEDGSIILQVERVLYKLSASVLMKSSPVFNAILSIPSPRDSSTASSGVQEGQSDEHPVWLEGISQSKFEHLMNYFWGNGDSDVDAAVTVESAAAVLELSNLYIIKRARRYAIEQLEHHPELDASMRLHLACSHRVTRWVRPAFEQLIRRPLEAFTPEHAAILGTDIYFDITLTKRRIEQHRRYLAYQAPPVINNKDCKVPLACELAWKEAWEDGPARMLNHPDLGLSGQEILMRLQSTAIKGICAPCRLASVERVQAGGALTREEVIVEDIVEKLIRSISPIDF